MILYAIKMCAYCRSRCVIMNAKEAEDKNLLLVHGKDHVKLIRNVSSIAFKTRRKRIAAKLNSIYLNEGSSESAYLAAGSVMEVTLHLSVHQKSENLAAGINLFPSICSHRDVFEKCSELRADMT